SRVYRRIRPYRDGWVTGFVVTVTGGANLRRFHEAIACHFLSPTKRQRVEAIAVVGSLRASRDIIPISVRTLLDQVRRTRGLTWEGLARAAGLALRTLGMPDQRKRGYRRWVIARLAHHFASE